MNNTKKKIGRPTLDAEGPRGAKIAFRPKKSVREYLERQVAEGESISIGTAINEAIERARMSEEEAWQQLNRAFGGAHNFALGWLVARIAVGVEHQRQRHWEKDGETFFQVGLAIAQVIRDLTQGAIWAELSKSNHPDENDDSLQAWIRIVEGVRKNLSNPQHPWWPIGNAELEENIIRPTEALERLSALPRNEMVPNAAKLRAAISKLNRDDYRNYIGLLTEVSAMRVQKAFESGGIQIDDLSEETLANSVRDDRRQIQERLKDIATGNSQKNTTQAKREETVVNLLDEKQKRAFRKQKQARNLTKGSPARLKEPKA